MQVVFVLPTVGMSGGIRVVAIYADGLAKMGHSVLIVSPPPMKPSYIRRIKSFIKGDGWPKYHRIIPSHIDRYNLEHRVLDRWRPITDADLPDADVIVATWWETAEWVNNLSTNKGAKTYLVQGYEIFDHLPIERVKATYRMPLHRIVISQWLRDILRREYNDNSTDLVQNGVDHAQFHAPIRGKQARPTIGFLYSDAKVKGVSTTLLVLKELKVQFPNIRVIAFGSVSPIGSSDWDPEIEFELSPRQDRLKYIYAQCDVWITSSRSEGFNLTAMEAMACRTPVVSTRTGWPIESIKDYENGMLVDIDDIHALKAAASWLLRLTDLEWRQVSDKAYSTVIDSTWERSTKLLERVLRNRCKNA
jgi:glycosyltransferase involved in cell wall biosynthesis